jgi:hypothetical protein
MSASLSAVVSLVVSLIFCVPNINALTSTPISENEQQGLIDEWRIQSSIPTTSIASGVSEICRQNSQEYLSALRSRLPWAVKSKLK